MAVGGDFNFRNFNVPVVRRQELIDYTINRQEPTPLVEAIASGDMIQTLAEANQEDLENLPAFYHYFYTASCDQCWGSREKVQAWVNN